MKILFIDEELFGEYSYDDLPLDVGPLLGNGENNGRSSVGHETQ